MRKAEKFKTGETLRNDIGPKLNRIVDLVNREIKGDQKTIMVSEVGKTISIKAKRSVSGGGGGNPGYIDISYDSDDQQFTIKLFFRRLCFGEIDYNDQYSRLNLFDNCTFVIDKPSSGQYNLQLGMPNGIVSTCSGLTTDPLRILASTDNLTGNSDTNESIMDSSQSSCFFTIVADLILNADGTYTSHLSDAYNYGKYFMTFPYWATTPVGFRYQEMNNAFIYRQSGGACMKYIELTTGAENIIYYNLETAELQLTAPENGSKLATVVTNANGRVTKYNFSDMDQDLFNGSFKYVTSVNFATETYTKKRARFLNGKYMGSYDVE